MTFTSGKDPGPPALGFLAGPKSGPPLLLLHGLGRSSQDYTSLATDLAQEFHAVALDFRGHGSSERTGEYRVVNYVSDTIEFIQRQFNQPVIIYGHSLGAMVSLGVAASISERVRGIILEDPPFHTMGRRIAGSAWASLFTAMQRVSRGGGAIEVMTQELAKIQLPAPNGGGFVRLGEVRSPDALRFSARCLSLIDPEVFTSPIAGRWLDGFDEGELFPRVRCPVLLLQGDMNAGAALTDEDAARAVSALRNCQRLRFPTGHLIRSERPMEVLRAAREFVLDLPSAPDESVPSSVRRNRPGFNTARPVGHKPT